MSPFTKPSNWIALAALAISLLGNIAVYISRTAVSHDNCVQIERLKSYAESATLRAKTTLPTLAYYKAHPKELKTALDEVTIEAKKFAPSTCSRQWLP